MELKECKNIAFSPISLKLKNEHKIFKEHYTKNTYSRINSSNASQPLLSHNFESKIEIFIPI